MFERIMQLYDLYSLDDDGEELMRQQLRCCCDHSFMPYERNWRGKERCRRPLRPIFNVLFINTFEIVCCAVHKLGGRDKHHRTCVEKNTNSSNVTS